MSKLTATEVRGLMEAYNAVYAPEEEVIEENLEQEIFETIAYALISQGHTAVDVIEYFANVDEEVIIEDIVAISEETLLIESVVSEEYVEEQFQILNEALPLLPLAGRAAMALARPAAGLIAKNAPKVASAATKLGQKASNIVWKGGSKATPMGRFPSGTATAPGTKLIGQKNILQKAVGKVKDVAKGALNKLPGGSGGKVAGALKTAGKWALGGAAFEAGARGINALMNDKSPTAKTAPAGKPPKAGMVNTSKGMRYKSSSDGKHYANYNDALAARRSRRGETGSPAKPSATPAPAAETPASTKPSSTTSTKPATTKTAPSGTAMQQWAKANPKLAAAAAERERTRGTSSTTNPLMKDMKSSLPAPKTPSPTTTKVAFAKTTPNLASTTQATNAASSTSPTASGSVAPATAKIAAASKPAPVAPRQTAREKVLNQSYEYDAYDIVLEYLSDNGHVKTLEEAHYVMMEMDSNTIQSIVEEKVGFFLTSSK